MDLLNSLPLPATADLGTALVSVLSAFACSHVLAVVYVWSHRGLSYSRSLVQTLVMAGVATAIMMLAIGNNVVWGIGMVGALALVRFRTNLRDPRDMIFVFASLVIGLAAGTRTFTVAICGTIVFSLVALYLTQAPFGLRGYFDGILRFTLAVTDPTANGAAQDCMGRHCSKAVLVMVQQVAQGDATEHVYQVRFRRGKSREELVRDLEHLPGLTDLSLMLEDARVEM